MHLAVTLKGQKNDLTLKNPILTASGTFGYGQEFAPFGDLSHLGGFIVKGLSLTPKKGNPTPRIVETTAGMLNAVGLQNDGVEHFCQETLPKLPWQKCAVIANIYASSVEEFGQLAKRLDREDGIAALEVNISCPNVQEGGLLFGQDPVMAAKVTERVRINAPHKHLMVKLSPNVTSIVAIAKSVEDAGADSISCINTLLGMSIDLAKRRPALANIVGGLSGPCIKPVALRCVWQVAKACSIPVVGIGGICTCEDILEFMLVGASAVQIGTANFINPQTSFNLVEALPKALAAYQINDLTTFRGSLKEK
ncbi:MAG: dihydroorotate dehydrogenase [Desulfovibrio sp.]|nr:dihydroorotate dehydrogenase [Desulfovibrio sp.]